MASSSIQAPEGPGHAGRQQPGPRHQVEAQLPEPLDGGRPRHRALPVDHYTRPLPAGAARIGTSPPGLVQVRLHHLEGEPAATAASKALPPRSSTAIPVAEASQWVEDTTPKDLRSSGRVANTP